MPKIIRMPDGTPVSFPDDVPDEFIRQLVREKFPDHFDANGKPLRTQAGTADTQALPDELRRRHGTPQRTPEEILEALRVADAAGDEAGARQLAEMYKAAKAAQQPLRRASNPMAAEKPEGYTPPGVLETGLIALEGAGKGAFNVGGIVGSRINPNYEADREARAARAPLAAGAGYLAGAMGSGGAAAKGLQAAPVVGRALAPVAGQYGRNVARYVAPGAVLGGVQAGAEGADIGTGVALGGAGAGAAVGAAKGAVALGRGVRNLVTPLSAGIRRAAKQINEDPTALALAMNSFRQATGRPPTLVEIIDAGSAENLARIAKVRPRAGAIFAESAQRVTAERARTMPRELERGGVGTVSNLDAARKQAFDVGMSQIGNSTAVLPQSMAPALRARIHRLADEQSRAGNTTPLALYARGEIDLRTLEHARQDLSALANTSPGRGYETMRNEAIMLGNRANKRYGKLLNEFGARSRQIEGMKAGQAGTNPANLTGGDRMDAGTMEYGVGRAGGTRTRLSQGAASERGAINTADKLRQSPAEVTEALGVHEAARLQRLGAAETQSGERLKQVTPRLLAPSDELSADIQAAVEAAAVAGGRTLTGFAVHAARRLVERLRMSAGTARRIAELATDPAQLPGVIAALRRARLNDQQIREILVPAGAGAGLAAGGAQ